MVNMTLWMFYPCGKNLTVPFGQEVRWTSASLDVVENRKMSCLYQELNPDIS